MLVRNRIALIRAPTALWLSALVAGALLPGGVALGEIRFWVDDDGVTHFTDDVEAVPEGVAARRAEEIEPLRAVWSEGITGPTVASGEGDSSFDDDRIQRLLRGALGDLPRDRPPGSIRRRPHAASQRAST